MKVKFLTKFLLVAIAIALFVAPAFAYTAFRSYYFSLDGWDGPMRIDMNAYCPHSAKVEIYNHSTGSLETHRYNAFLNGNWRIFTSMQPRTNYSVSLYCFDGNNQGTSRHMQVWYSGAYISVH